jgi:thiol-disulfide isomerase/thioredoxin
VKQFPLVIHPQTDVGSGQNACLIEGDTFQKMKPIRRKIALLFLLTGLLSLLLSSCSSSTNNAQNTNSMADKHPVVIYMFWGDGCPHCAKAEPFLEGLADKSPLIELRFFEVWYNKTNQQYFKDMCAAFGFEPQGVPTIFIGEKHWIGYGESMNEEITNAVNTCLENGCPDRGVGVLPPWVVVVGRKQVVWNSRFDEL